MKYFWHTIALVNTVCFVLFVYMLCGKKIEITTISYVHGDVEVTRPITIDGIPKIEVEDMPKIIIDTDPAPHPRYSPLY